METRNRTLWTFVVTSLALVMVTLDNLVVTTALPVIRKDLGAGIEGLEWTVNAYTLTFAVLLADRRRARRPLRPPAACSRSGSAIFTLASAAAALAPSIEVLVAARAVQGVGGAIVTPLTLTHPLRGGAGREARRRARRLGRDRRPRRRARPARRRRGRLRPLLAVDLLDQRADRPRR